MNDATVMMIIIALLGLFAMFGCAHDPYYSGTAAPHFTETPCNADNCGKQPAWR